MRRAVPASTRVARVHHRVVGGRKAAAVAKRSSCSVMNVGADFTSTSTSGDGASRTVSVWDVGSIASSNGSIVAVCNSDISGFSLLLAF
jgi:hypothetical protein